MYLLCMIKARIRWCTCRVENILTLGKLLSLWFCFLLHSILFLISQTSYRTYKIISSYELARPIMGTIFLVIMINQKINSYILHFRTAQDQLSNITHNLVLNQIFDTAKKNAYCIASDQYTNNWAFVMIRGTCTDQEETASSD